MPLQNGDGYPPPGSQGGGASPLVIKNQSTFSTQPIITYLFHAAVWIGKIFERAVFGKNLSEYLNIAESIIIHGIAETNRPDISQQLTAVIKCIFTEILLPHLPVIENVANKI